MLKRATLGLGAINVVLLTVLLALGGRLAAADTGLRYRTWWEDCCKTSTEGKAYCCMGCCLLWGDCAQSSDCAVDPGG
jgi:hypothetical protein